jgi:hypothetical protein
MFGVTGAYLARLRGNPIGVRPLFGAAYIEERVTEAIRSRFVTGVQSDPDFLGSRGAGSPFAAKIDLALLLGLVGPNAHRDLGLAGRVQLMRDR